MSTIDDLRHVADQMEAFAMWHKAPDVRRWKKIICNFIETHNCPRSGTNDVLPEKPFTLADARQSGEWFLIQDRNGVHMRKYDHRQGSTKDWYALVDATYTEVGLRNNTTIARMPRFYPVESGE